MDGQRFRVVALARADEFADPLTDPDAIALGDLRFLKSLCGLLPLLPLAKLLVGRDVFKIVGGRVADGLVAEPIARGLLCQRGRSEQAK